MTEGVTMDDLTAFIRARLGEDERELEADPPRGLGYANLAARMRREIKAKRRILADYEQDYARLLRDGVTADEYDGGWCAALEHAVKLFAAVYSDHPDYRQEWAP